MIWINHHQILISAIIAGYAAWRTIRNVKKQMAQSERFRLEDEKETIRNNAITFVTEYADLTTEVFSYYRCIKESIPNGFTGPLWTVIPYLFELERKEFNFSKNSIQIFTGEGGGHILKELLFLQGSRNKLASANRHWNSIKLSSADIFLSTAEIDKSSGQMIFTYNDKDLTHKKIYLESEPLLESSIFSAEEQIQALLDLEPKLSRFLSKKLEDENFLGFIVSTEDKKWFKENSSDV